MHYITISLRNLSLLNRVHPLCCRRATASDAVSWYLHSVGNTNVLTRNEEVQLGAIMHLGSTVRQAQQDLQAANGSEPSLDEVHIVALLTLAVDTFTRLGAPSTSPVDWPAAIHAVRRS